MVTMEHFLNLLFNLLFLEVWVAIWFDIYRLGIWYKVYGVVYSPLRGKGSRLLKNWRVDV